MPTLHDVQRAMRAHVLANDSGIASMIAGDHRTERLGIYGNTVVVTLTRALRLAFPVIYKLVGEEFFEAMAATFIPAHPPRAACLDLYGEEFPAFLAQFEPARSLGYLPDVAGLEWAVNRALHAPDILPVDLDVFAAIPESDVAGLRLSLHPSLTFLELQSPADAIWRAVIDGDDDGLAAISLDHGPVYLLIERGSSGVVMRRIEPGAWQFGLQLAQDHSLGEAIEAVPNFDAIPELAAHLAAGRVVAVRRSDQRSSFPQGIADD